MYQNSNRNSPEQVRPTFLQPQIMAPSPSTILSRFPALHPSHRFPTSAFPIFKSEGCAVDPGWDPASSLHYASPCLPVSTKHIVSLFMTVFSTQCDHLDRIATQALPSSHKKLSYSSLRRQIKIHTYRLPKTPIMHHHARPTQNTRFPQPTPRPPRYPPPFPPPPRPQTWAPDPRLDSCR